MAQHENSEPERAFFADLHIFEQDFVIYLIAFILYDRFLRQRIADFCPKRPASSDGADEQLSTSDDACHRRKRSTHCRQHARCASRRCSACLTMLFEHL
ncbi:MAG: hypothetical protein WBM14_17960 [Terracidiphilus sp.]|jgi:hypothetical protein